MPRKKKPPRRLPGEGTIYQRKDGLYRVEVSLGKDSEGKRIRKVAYARTHDEAITLRNDLLNDRKKAELVGKAEQKLADFLDDWLAGQLALAPNTRGLYERSIRLHIVPALGHLSLAEITPQHVSNFLVALRQKGSKAKNHAGEPLSPRTVQATRNVLRAALNDALKWGTIARNAAALADAPADDHKAMSPLTVQEANHVLDVARDTPLEALWALLLGLGLRPAEACALHWSDVDLERGTVQIHRNLQPNKGKLEIRDTKTPAGRRLLPLPGFAVAALRRRRALSVSLMVFTDADGSLLNRYKVRRRWRALLKAAGIPYHRPYDLRHTCASFLFAHGVEPKVVQEILGHSSIQVTLDIYTHLIPGAHQQAASAMDGVLGHSLATGREKQKRASQET